MKKLIPIVLIAILAVVVVIQYLKLQRLSPQEEYVYALREDIDLDYHQPVVVGAYYTAGREVGAFAREMWYNHSINVRLADNDDPAERDAARHYQRLLAYADSLGARLHRSQRLKDQGYNNADIRQMETEGRSPAEVRVMRAFGATRLAQGDKSEAVWALQEILIGMGYTMPHDGNFGVETSTAASAFQKKNGLPPTGIANLATLTLLIDPPSNPQ